MTDPLLSSKTSYQPWPEPVETLSITHIFDGEEVVTAGEDGQTWIATFACYLEADEFVKGLKAVPGTTVVGQRKRSAHETFGNRWHPIESAPRGQAWVLVWWPAITDVALVAYRVGDKWAAATNGDMWANEVGPTHWQPLPEPPSSAVNGSGDQT